MSPLRALVERQAVAAVALATPTLLVRSDGSTEVIYPPHVTALLELLETLPRDGQP